MGFGVPWDKDRSWLLIFSSTWKQSLETPFLLHSSPTPCAEHQQDCLHEIPKINPQIPISELRSTVQPNLDKLQAVPESATRDELWS